MVDASPFDRKALACFLWPEMPMASAVSKFNGKLNSDCNDGKDGHFTPEQVLVLMTKTNQYQPLHFICEQTGHEVPAKLAADDIERQRIEAVSAATEALNHALALLGGK
jgi:hypothetical protein